MAITDAYATVDTYRAHAGKIDSASDEVIKDDLEAISRYIEGMLGGRYFTKDAVATARIFNPAIAGASLYVDDIATLTGLSILVDTYRTGSFAGLTPLTSTQYQAYPLNAASGPEPRPYTQLYIPAWSTAYYWSPTAPVQVTAVWGWPAVPKLIEKSCIELTRILRLESPRATNRFTDMGEVLGTNRQARDIVTKLADQYRHVVIA